MNFLKIKRKWDLNEKIKIIDKKFEYFVIVNEINIFF